jgi:hypothetical protein|tara:strand:- start:822 stop:1094 length:273 start_codon:yes stop_codon:yes gene_type:complete
MSEVEQQAPKAVYRNEETDYDVSKLTPEAQQAFMLLAQLQQNELRQAEIILNYYKAAQAHYNNVIKAGLTEEAIVGAEFTEVEEEEVKAE